jgi:phosphoenolpyruvate-protein phosphotransferase (PTS system enzyme I)
MPDTPMQILEGRGVSEGVAIGHAVCIQGHIREVYRFPLPEGRLEDEVERLNQAVRQAEDELQQLRSQGAPGVEEDLGGIFEAHLLMLRDPAFLDRVIEHIRREKVNAEWAVHRTVEDIARQFRELDNEYIRDRNQDVLDVGGYLLRILQGISHHELSEIEGDIIIVADDLPPSEAIRLGRQGIIGFAIEAGGRTSHTTIVARSLKIPMVTGLTGMTEMLTDEDPVIIDGKNGKVVLHPTKSSLREYQSKVHAFERQETDLLATRDLVARTLDDVPIQLLANIDLVEEADGVSHYGAAGVGLYRSEFLYIESSPDIPTEEDHLDAYQRLVVASGGGPTIIRTYDLGGRKIAREVMDIQEDNPVLGLRGIRLTMARPSIFKTQLRALFRAAVSGDLWMMLPLVTTVEEVRLFKVFAEETFQELEAEGVPCRREAKLGIMIEVPAAAIIADMLAEEVDFFSIGTNDLIQYSLAVDRNNQHVADLYQPLHPAMLRMLGFVVGSARSAGIETSICGEMAGDMRIAPLLVGLGLRRLSMSPRTIPAVKTCLRELSTGDLEELVVRCKLCRTAEDVGTNLDQFLARRLSPQVLGL